MPKIEYGIKNVYFAKRNVTKNEDGTVTVTYDKPDHVPYARSTDIAPSGESTPVYADNIEIETLNSNQGYTGTLNFTSIPDEILEKYLGQKRDKNGMLVEDADAQSVPFAMMFQFENDVKATKHVFYNCVLTRPNISSSTKEASITVNDKALSITARVDSELIPEKNIVKSKTTEQTSEEVYNKWFNEVCIPDFTTVPVEG